MENENQELRENQGDSKSLLPNSDEDVIKIQELAKERPVQVFERMREIMAELIAQRPDMKYQKNKGRP